MRGYISSALGVPVHVQNIIVRDYCQKKGLLYELAEVENKTNFDILERVLQAAPEGIVAYSLAQFDEERLKRVQAACPLHFAMEGFPASAGTGLLLKLKRLLG